VAYTKPKQESVARENLARQHYGVYLPQLKIARNTRGQQRVRFEPLFPRYLFFRPEHTQHSIAPVRSTVGVSALVRFGGMPAILRSATIDCIRQFEAEQHQLDLTELSGLAPGKTVLITTGPFAGLEGLVAMISRQRVVVLMRLLGEDTKVRLSIDELRLAA
jgi:transcriptional antiterminator RfaH